MQTKKRKRQRVISKTAAILRSSRRLVSNNVIDIKTSLKNNDAVPRCIVVTPKAIGNAVKRNLVRRRIKALWHLLQLKSTPYHWIFFCKKGITELSYQDLSNILTLAQAQNTQRHQPLQ